MQLYILDEDPLESANILFNKTNPQYAFKMLIELGQLICSTSISNVYKSVSQGKRQQEFIIYHSSWIFSYFNRLYYLCAHSNLNLSSNTENKLCRIGYDLSQSFSSSNIIEAPFRYSKEYKCNILTDTILPIEECIKEYRKYLEWKIIQLKK